MKTTRTCLWLLLTTLAFLSGCKKEELPPTDVVNVKFINKTGVDILGLYVEQLEVGDIAKGKSTADYFQFDALGQQFGYALVEAVATIGKKRHFASASCQGECGTPSAPQGEWLLPGYYKISIRIAPPGDYMDFIIEK